MFSLHVGWARPYESRSESSEGQYRRVLRPPDRLSGRETFRLEHSSSEEGGKVHHLLWGCSQVRKNFFIFDAECDTLIR
jgi:hypothetical protein